MCVPQTLPPPQGRGSSGPQQLSGWRKEAGLGGFLEAREAAERREGGSESPRDDDGGVWVTSSRVSLTHSVNAEITLLFQELTSENHFLPKPTLANSFGEEFHSFRKDIGINTYFLMEKNIY